MSPKVKFLDYVAAIMTFVVVIIGLLLMNPGIVLLRHDQIVLIFVINNTLVFITLVLYIYLMTTL